MHLLMKPIVLLLVILTVSFAFGAVSFGSNSKTNASLSQTGAPCDASKVIGRCSATISKVNNWARITSSTNDCSVVDWYLGPQPQTTVVRGGSEQVELLLSSENSDLSVASCRIVETLDSADYGNRMIEVPAKCYCGPGNSQTVYVSVPENSTPEERQSYGERACAPFTQRCQANARLNEPNEDRLSRNGNSQACDAAVQKFQSGWRSMASAMSNLQNASRAISSGGGGVGAYCQAARSTAAQYRQLVPQTLQAGNEARQLCRGREGYENLLRNIEDVRNAAGNPDRHVQNCISSGH